MIFTVPLQPGTVLANVLKKWIAAGAPGAPDSAGITQPDASFPVFRIDSEPPVDAEEMIVYDSTDLPNWNAAGYRKGLEALGAAQQILLGSLWQPTLASQVIVPANPPMNSICRCFGTFKDLSALSVDGLDVTFTLVAVDNTDPTIIYDLAGTTLKNTETGQLITNRVVTASLVAGQIQDVNANPYVDLNRTDFISGHPANTTVKYLLTSEALGAPMGLSLSTQGGPLVFTPVLFELNLITTGFIFSGTFDLSKKAT